MYISQDYNEDEDVELLELLALIADINDERIVAQSEDNELLNGIREDVFRFTRSKEVQQMILAELHRLWRSHNILLNGDFPAVYRPILGVEIDADL